MSENVLDTMIGMREAATDPPAADAHFRTALDLEAAGDRPAAIDELRKAIQRDNTPEHHFKLAYCLDLVAEEIQFIVNRQDTTVAAEGVNVHIIATIANRGVGSFEGMMEVGMFIGDPDAGGRWMASDQVIGPIGPDTSFTVEFDWMPDLGTHAITVFVDPVNTVYESDEDNNQLGKGLSVARKPLADLSISSMRLLLNGVELDPTEGTNEGANVEINITVKNTGNEKTKAETVTELILGNPLLGGESLGSFRVPEGLNPDEVYTSAIYWQAQRPNKRSDIPVLFVIVDALSAETEVNEFNNFDMRMLPVGESLPDLTVTSITITDEAGVPVDRMTYGVPITIKVEIANVGTDFAYQVANVDFYLDDTDPSNLIDSIPTSTFAIGETVTKSIKWKPDPTRVAGGPHTIIAHVDPTDEIGESSDANNKLTASIRIDATAKPNLLVMDIEVKRNGKVVDRVNKDDTASIRVRVINLGDAPLYTTAIIELFHGEPTQGGLTVHAWELEELAVGETATFETNHTFEEDVPLIVQIDRTQKVMETNENDNVGSLHITVESPPEGANYIGITALMAIGVVILLLVGVLLRRRPTAPLEDEGEGEDGEEGEDGDEAEVVVDEEADEEVDEEADEVAVEEKPAAEGPADEPAPAPASRCPSCGEEIDADWILCPFCDSKLK